MELPEQDRQALIEAARRRSQTQQGGAAFGVYPSSGKRPEKLNVSRDVNMPAQVARGWAAGLLGLPGDIESLGRLGLGLAGADVSETPVLPTSDFYREYLPGYDPAPAARAASGLGALAGGAGATRVAGAAVKGAKATGKALGPKAAEMAEGYLQRSGLAPSVVKPKGGNWLSGSVEGATGPLKGGMVAGQTPAERIPLHEALLQDPTLPPESVETVRRQLDRTRGEDAINNWIDTKLNKYIRNEMATPEDPVRKLAERGVTHLPEGNLERANEWTPDTLGGRRKAAGFPEEGYATTPAGKGWEQLADEAIHNMPAGERIKQRPAGYQEYQGQRPAGYQDPDSWLDKVPPETMTYGVYRGIAEGDELGMQHLIDELRNATRADSDLPANLRWKPEDLKKVTMEQAVERVAKINEYRAAKKAEANEVLARNPATAPYKDYETVPGTQEPNSKGLAWKQIKSPEPALEEGYRVVKDEPFQSNWQVVPHPEGNGFALRAANGEFASNLNGVPERKWATAEQARADISNYADVWEPDPDELYKLVDSAGNVLARGQTESKVLSQLKRSEREKALADALKYEGDVMGHCVGGYCDDVLEGRSQIYSLRDKKGEPHVTIETVPGRPWNQRSGIFYEYPELENPWAAFSKEVNAAARAKGVDRDPNYIIGFPDWLAQNQPEVFAKYQAIFQEPPAEIVQIKGKGNAAPKAEYLPFVQDFVRSGNWSKVGDLKNTGLIKLGDQYLPKEEVGPLVERASRFIEETPALREHREAQRAYENYSGPVPSAEYTALQRAAGRQVHPTIPYTYRELRAILDDPDAFADRNTDALAPNLERIERLRQLVGEQGYAKGGLVQDTDAIAAKLTGMDKDKALTHALRMANAKQEAHMAAGGLAKVLKGAKAAKEAEEAAKPAIRGTYQALPLQLPRAPNLPPQEITKTAERIARQQMGEHVRKAPNKAESLAGRSMKEVERLKKLDIDIRPTKQIPTPTVVPEKKGEVRIGLPGDITVADQMLMSVDGLPIRAQQEGGALYGFGKMDLEDPAFWASNKGPAQQVQNKITDVSNLFDTPDVLAMHLAMGHDAMNFAQHFADANLRAIQKKAVNPDAAKTFNEIIRAGNPSTGQQFPNFPGIENYKKAYKALQEDPEMRKWFNDRMKKDSITEPLGLPSGKEIEYAIMEPELRNMEHSLVGLSVGRMKPGAELMPDSPHKTYSHDIPGLAVGRTQELLPVDLAFPDAAAHIRRTNRPQDFTGTIQKVFPHQVVDDQYINQLGEYYTRLKQIRGYKKGGAVKKSGLSVLNKAII